jgi:hypothetical protein
MHDLDLAGLRTAVEDAAERAPFAHLVERAAIRRRRRIGTGLGLLALVLVAALAATTGTARLRSDRPPATPPPSQEYQPPSSQQLLDAKFGARRAYALVGTCAIPDEPVTCRYALQHSEDGGRTWRSRYEPVPPLERDEGFSAELLLTGPEETLAILDLAHGQVYQSTDRVDTYARHRLRTGPPVDTVALTAAIRTNLCTDAGACPAALASLDPATGVVAPLRQQPPLPTGPASATFDDRGGLWVAGPGAGPAAAYSPDRGRSWRPLPTPPALRGIQRTEIAPLPNGTGAYLLGARHQGPEALNDFAELWRIGDPTAAGAVWTRITPPNRPKSAQTAVGLGDGSLLFAEEGGGLWRVTPTGEISAVLLDVDGTPFRPTAVHRGSGSLLYAEDNGADRDRDHWLVVSHDDGRTWQRSAFPLI